jgi:hypothetical protein
MTRVHPRRRGDRLLDRLRPQLEAGERIDASLVGRTQVDGRIVTVALVVTDRRVLLAQRRGTAHREWRFDDVDATPGTQNDVRVGTTSEMIHITDVGSEGHAAAVTALIRERTTAHRRPIVAPRTTEDAPAGDTPDEGTPGT